MSDHVLSNSELEGHLGEQLGFLQRSAHAFDEGYRAETKRMAITLRIILHTRRYPSLLKQLGRDEIDFLDTAHEFNPANLLSTHSLICLSIRSGQVSYLAAFDSRQTQRRTPFKNWWSSVIFADQDKRQMTRSDLVLTIADQDGGAHVDGQLNAVYAAISRENSLGWRSNSATGDEQPILGAEQASIRQIAHEVLRTLVPGYSRSSEQAIAARRTAEISGGKMRFFPGDQTFFKNQLVAPVVTGSSYLAEIAIDSMTTGSVRVVVGSAVSEPIMVPGVHQVTIVSMDDKPTGVFGDYSDAVIDHVAVYPIA